MAEARKIPLRVAINAQLMPDGAAGGVEQAVLGLIHALGRLEDDDTEYVIIAHSWAPDWFRPYLGRNQCVVRPPLGSPIRQMMGIGKRMMWPIRPALVPGWRRIQRLFRRDLKAPLGPSLSDGFIESLGVDVAHFPYQFMVLSAIPSIFNPWDLQHRHYPEFFPPSVFASREATYPVYCRHAAAVATASQCMRQDVIRQYNINPQKVYVIPLAASTEIPVAAERPDGVRRVYGLPEDFALYPAQTWPHKNHLRLLEAIALLRDRHGLRIRLVCTGALNEFWQTIARRIRELRLEDQVSFLGFIPQGDLSALYRLATFVVLPSLFEGWGFPLIEAFREGVAVASSGTTSLGEYAGEAAMLFDATSVESIAQAVGRLATDAALREALVRRGRERGRTFSWHRAAMAYRALYRKVAGIRLSEEDQQLLSSETASAPSF